MFQHFLQKILIPLEAHPGDAESLTAWAVQALLGLAPGFAEHQSRLGNQSNLVIYSQQTAFGKQVFQRAVFYSQLQNQQLR